MHRFYTEVINEGEHRGLVLQLRRCRLGGPLGLAVLESGKVHAVSDPRDKWDWTTWCAANTPRAMELWRRLMANRRFPHIEEDERGRYILRRAPHSVDHWDRLWDRQRARRANR